VRAYVIINAHFEELGLSADFFSLRRLWLGLALIYLLLIAHLVIYAAQPGQGESASFRILALVNVVISLVVTGFALWFRPEWVDRIPQQIRRFRWAYIAGGLALTLLVGLEMRPEWFYAHMAFAAASLLTLFYWTFFEGIDVRSWDNPPLGKILILTLMLLCFLLVTFIRIYGLSEYPEKEVVDEPWLMGIAVSYGRTGALSDWIMLSVKGSPQHDIPRFLAALGVWLRIVGAGFWEARLFSFLLIIPVVAFTSLAARNLYGTHRTGWLTAAALFSSAVLMFGGRIRHDIGLTLSFALSLWLFSMAVKDQGFGGTGVHTHAPLRTQSETNLLHFLAGAAMGSGLFSHYNAVALAPIITLGLYLPRYFNRFRQGKWWPESGFWFYALGGLLMGGVVIAIQVLPDLNAFLTNQAPRTTSAASSTVNAIVGHIANIPRMSQLEALLLLIAVIAALWRRRAADWTLLIILVLGHIALGYVARTPYKYYIVPLSPVYGMLIGALFSQGFGRSAGVVINQGASSHVTNESAKLAPIQRMIIPALFFLTINLGMTLDAPLNHLLRGEPMRPPAPPAAQWVLDNVPEDQTVLAANSYFLWLENYRFASPLIPIVMPAAQAEQYASRQALWDDMGVDVIIADPGAQSYDFITPLLEPDYLQSRGYELAAQVPDGDNMVEIYRR
jgi:hypothetical protein